MNITPEDKQLIIEALADHAATLMRLAYTMQRKRPEKSVVYKVTAQHCLNLAVDLEKDDLLKVLS